MKQLIVVLILTSGIAFGQVLTDEDLRKIDQLIVASEKRTREYIDLKIAVTDQKIESLSNEIVSVRSELKSEIVSVRNEIVSVRSELKSEIVSVRNEVRMVFMITLALLALIGVPQMLMMWRDRILKSEIGDTMKQQINELKKEIEELRQQQIVQ